MVEKKEEVIVATYKLHLHCKECAKEVDRKITKFIGVRKVETDLRGGKVKVTGVFDVKKLHEHIEKKIRKKVELISPIPKVEVKPPVKKVEEKKEVIKTITIKTHIHCKRCEYDIKSKMIEHKGIHKFETNRGAQTCTVIGTIEEKDLIEYLYKRTGKRGEIVKVEKKEEKEVKIEVKEIKKEEIKIDEKPVAPYFVHCTHPWMICDQSQYAWYVLHEENPYACHVM